MLPPLRLCSRRRMVRCLFVLDLRDNRRTPEDLRIFERDLRLYFLD